jgi:carboxylesterase
VPVDALPYQVLPGCEPLSHTGTTGCGVLLVHGFTGNPSSMRGVADAMIAAGHHVEVPRLPGHGTHLDDMLATEWSAWSAEVAQAHAALAARVERTVAVGQSMGGTLALWLALEHPGSIAGLVCINPVTRRRADDELAMIDELIEDGISVVPGEGSDIADPDATEISYDGTPLAPLRSFLRDGVDPIADRFGELTVPLRLLTSRQDHVVAPGDSVHLAEVYGGAVDHTWLERSYHVATRDHDRDLVEASAVEFVAGVAS